MDAGIRALLGGFATFVLTTALLRQVSGRRLRPLDAVTVGGFAGGGVALWVWCRAAGTRGTKSPEEP